MADSIEGYVQHIVYRNDENGYTVLVLEVKNDEVTCVGSVPAVEEGAYLKAEGEYRIHPTYGMQFHMNSAQVSVPQNGIALERYLGSGAIKGIGPALASRIIKKFGDDTMRILEEEPERLAEVRGISEKKAREIGVQAIEKSQMQNALIFLAQYNIPLSLGIRIYNRYQDTLYQVLRQNPYQLADDIEGVGFKRADEIAAKVGISRDSEFRIRSAILYVLSQASGEGHMYLPQDVLTRRVVSLLGTDPASTDVEPELTNLSVEKKIVRKQPQNAGDPAGGSLIYASSAYFTELDTARMLNDLNVVTGEKPEEVDRRIRKVEQEDDLVLDDLQREAVRTAACHGIMVLTGGPGTGKTTTINTMIRYFQSEKLNIALAAPTGRAAKRMTEATGREASTIHRLLEVSGMSDDSPSVQFERNDDNPLEQDVIIIDEASMVDIYLMHALLKAVVPGTRLVLVGDRYQLPSVGPGSVLKDIIRSGEFPVVTLNKIFRQAQESDIIVNAHRINAGEPVRTDNKSRDFFFLKSQDAGVVQQAILALVASKLPRYVHAAVSDIQVLTPSRKGALGVENLNQYLQRYLNPSSPEKKEKETAQGIFREGDKVMQIRNDYQLEWEVRNRYGIAADSGLGVFNGDMGVIRSIEPDTELLTVAYEEGKIVDYTFNQLDELELAYAVTVHKAQGSEYPAVVIPLLGVPRMLQTRNLLYTAVTRARKCVVLIGDLDTFQYMISNGTEECRYTSLAGRIREMASADSALSDF
ncbi:MAG: ATP-dependent RecD-like DNA helicase [Eubacteriales bacterium]|jgi:exodeoxyribonuclease V alpha subunit